MADKHQMIVDNIGEMVRWQIVGTLVQHFVVKNRRIDLHLPANEIVDHHIAARLDLEPHHILVSLIDKTVHFVGRQRQRIAHRKACRGIILEVGVCRAGGFKFLGSIESYISLSGVKQKLYVLAVYVAALTLLVRAILSPFPHAFVNAYAKPCQSLVYILLGSGHESL